MNSRQKGKRGELELANLLKEHGYNTRRGQQYSGIGMADVIGLPGIHIECKRVEALNVYNAMDQSRIDAPDGEVPVVMHRKNGKGWLVTMELDDWLTMYELSKDAWPGAEWLEVPAVPNTQNNKFLCSNCGYTRVGKSKYCPACGTCMDIRGIL